MSARHDADVGRGSRRSGSSGIFISYRREDASGFAGRLHESLSRHFGPARIFRDVDDMTVGVDFPTRIHETLGSCGALVAVIGREWLVDSKGRRRLEEPDDWVRQEILAALERDDVLVVPVLVEGTTMPSAGDLPAPLAPLTRRHALEIADSRWAYDVGLLAKELEVIAGPPRPSWRARATSWPAGAAAVVVAVAVLAVALFLVLRPSPSPPPRRMTGEFNIAVARFGAADSAGTPVESSEGPALAASVFERLRAELAPLEESGFDLDLRPPDETGAVEGRTRDQQAASAAREAQRIGADMIVYGTLATGDPSQFGVEFFVGEGRLDNAEELYGQHELGLPIDAAGDIARNAAARRQLREEVLGRTHALSEFIIGLSYYSINDLQPAFDHFQAARSNTRWEDRDGKEVLYLFLGNSAGKLATAEQGAGRPSDLGAARAFYDRALELNPEYARARLGRAEVLLHEARGNCESGGADAGGLTRSIEAFREAQAAKVQPALSDVPAKVIFGLARAHLCLSQALAGDNWTEAERGFQQVVRQFDFGNHRLRGMAAEAHAGLGFVYLPPAGEPDAAGRYRRAADEYERAIDLTRVDDRKAFFLSMRGFALSRSGDLAGADAAYQAAIRLASDPVTRAGYEEARRRLSPPA